MCTVLVYVLNNFVETLSTTIHLILSLSMNVIYYYYYVFCFPECTVSPVFVVGFSIAPHYQNYIHKDL